MFPSPIDVASANRFANPRISTTAESKPAPAAPATTANVVMLPSILLAIGAAFITPDLTWRAALIGGVFAFIVVYVAVLLSRGGLGEGDVTLSTFLGFILGFPHIILSLLFGVFFGGVVAFLLLVSLVISTLLASVAALFHGPEQALLSRLLELAVSLLVLTFVFALLYK